MKDSKLQQLVTAACDLDREISTLRERLAGMKIDLVTEAESR